MKLLSTIAALAACVGASPAIAATFEASAAMIHMEVFDGTGWTNNIVVVPGTHVQWRVRVQYTGSQFAPGQLFGLARARFQPVFSNVDNSGASMDIVSPWRNGGVQGLTSGAFLSAAEGAGSSPLPSYGIVAPFIRTQTSTSSFNVITTYRHSGGSQGAPAGEYIRVAGSGASNWPAQAITVPTGTQLADIARGVPADQWSQSIGSSNGIGHTTSLDVVVMRGGFHVSFDFFPNRVIDLDIYRGSLLRAGGATSTDDTRGVWWQTDPTDTAGTHFTEVSNANFVGTSITVVPAPSVAGLALAALLGIRRRSVRS